MLEQLLQNDSALFLYLNGLGSPTWDAFWMVVTNKFYAIPLYLGLLFLVYKKYGLKYTLLILVGVALMIAVTDQLANFFKYGVGRLRPCYNTEINGLTRLVKASCGGKYGYFSAHAANSFAVAIFFRNIVSNKFLTAGLIIWALFVGYSRIYIGVHYPLDVMTGMLIGVIFGWLFSKLVIFASLKFKI